MDRPRRFPQGALAFVFLLRRSLCRRRCLPLRDAEAGREAYAECFLAHRFSSSRGTVINLISLCLIIYTIVFRMHYALIDRIYS